jgi:hypothetical protein
MRKALQKMDAERGKFTAIFECYGSKMAFRGRTDTTLLFREVRNSEGMLVADHLWFVTNKEFEKYSFRKGDMISFEARVKEYKKGYQGLPGGMNKPAKTDYKLSHPTRVLKQA